MKAVEYGIAMKGLESESGDMALVLEDGNRCLLVLLDVLGHGSEAAEIARMARRYVTDHKTLKPGMLISGLHKSLGGTRGAVGAVILLHADSGIFVYEGIGNVTVECVGATTSVFIPAGGVIGDFVGNRQQKRSRLFRGDILLMYSDGIRDGFSPYEWADLQSLPARKLAQGLLERFKTGEDDASVIVLKYGHLLAGG